jgi:hypothetical protein
VIETDLIELNDESSCLKHNKNVQNLGKHDDDEMMIYLRALCICCILRIVSIPSCAVPCV